MTKIVYFSATAENAIRNSVARRLNRRSAAMKNARETATAPSADAPTSCSEDEEKLMIDLSKGYNYLILPVQNLSTLPMTVKITIQLVLLINVDEKNQVMQTNVWLTIKWFDFQMKWNPVNYGDIKQIRISPDKVWLPDIVLFNNADGNYEVSFMCNVVVEHTGQMLWVPPAIYKSSCIIDVEYFPFDEQICDLVFGSWTYNADEIKLEFVETEMIDVSEYQASSIWDLIDAPASLVNLRSQAVFHVRIRRKTLFYTVVLIIPTVVMAFLSVAVFFLPTDSTEKMTLTISVLLSIVVFLLLVSKILPPTSSTIPLMAKYLLLTFVLNVITILVTVIIINVYFRSPKTHRMPNWVRRIFINFMPRILCMQRPRSTMRQNLQETRKRVGAHLPGVGRFALETGPHHPHCPSAAEKKSDRKGSTMMNDPLTAAFYPLSPEALKAVDAVEYITDHLKKEEEHKMFRDDWKYVAMIIDRLLLYIFSGITIGGTCGILFSAPTVFESIDQMTIIEQLKLLYKREMAINSPYPSVEICQAPTHELLDGYILQWIKRNPNTDAFINAEDPSQRISYKQLYDFSFSLATLLTKRGFGHLDVASVVLPNSIEYGTFYLAVSRLGAIFSGVSASFTADEIGRQFVDNQCKVVMTDTECIERVIQAASKCPHIKTIICVSRDGAPIPKECIDWNEAVKTKAEPLPKYKFSPDDIALLPYSSGTTGPPKGVMLTHKSFTTMMNGMLLYGNNHFKPHLINKTWDGTHDYFILPFYHLYGFGMLIQAIMKGLPCVIVPKFNPMQFLADIQTYKLQILFIVPPIVLLLTKIPPSAIANLSSIRIVISSAAPIGIDLAKDFLAKYPNAWLGQGFGLTETGMATTLPELDIREQCIDVGMPFSNVTIKLVDTDTGKEVGRGQRGEVWVSSPCLMKGYLNRPQATREMIDEQGWLHTGDVAYLDENGRIFIVDRIKELIKVKGLQVAPAELEDILLTHPQIGDAAVIGIADDAKGEIPKAYIVKRDENLTAEIVMKYVAGKVAKYKQLAGGIEFVNAIPKSPSGKILRRILREAAKSANKQKL
ncbi:hypothetical protein WR25_19795 [Diploscapter pachys]|uniref:Uncharacterized protein n=1 Tax=Diploscapter pachys TaxID=2018661 RepID=A0A2A2JDZ9_9BILA|nr:hypothetical protein WR25_19795 [Diploscapter pachys]